MPDIKQIRPAKPIILVILLAGLAFSGCIGPRGWPGPLVDGGTLFVGSRDGGLFALDADSGSREWQWEPEVEPASIFDCGAGGRFTGGKFYGRPVVVDDLVYIGAYDGSVYAIDADDGSEKWSYDTGSPIVGGVAFADGTIFVGSSDGKLYALDVTTTTAEGRLKEGFEPFQAADKIWSTPVLQDGVVYFGSLDHKLYAIDADTGELKWDRPFETGGAIISPALVVGGVVYIGSFDSKFYAVYADTGEPKWGQPFEAGNWFWPEPLYDDGTIYVCSLDHSVYAIDAESGILAWSEPFETAGPLKSSPVISGGVLVVASENGEVYALDLETGKERWQFDLEVKVLAPLSAVDGMVYLNAQDNKVYAIDVEAEPRDRIKWSKSLSEAE